MLHFNLLTIFFIVALFDNRVDAWTHELQRRTLIATLASNAIISPRNVPLEGSGGKINRVEEIGGGYDLMQPQIEKGSEPIFPASMEGTWRCTRSVVAMEGDIGQAEQAYRNLGGSLDKPTKGIESYTQTFMIPPSNWNMKNDYLFEGKTYQGAILDRGLDISARRNGNVHNVSWNIDTQTLHYETDNDKVDISVVQRKVEYPSANGFGFDELYKLASSAGGLFGDTNVLRAVRVKRRYRRALDENGNRIVDGIELMKTYRVLDGIAGIEMPTSTTKSQIQLSRN